MKKSGKILALVLAAVLLVGASVFGTMAYLTSTDVVTNTFTVGKVSLTLDEAEVGTDGKALTGETAERVKENSYKLLPGKVYDKDPTVHVGADSEPAWLFVKVENGIAAIEAEEADYTSIAAQIVDNGWAALTGVENVYCKAYNPASPDVLDYNVFETFKIKGDINGDALAAYATKTTEDSNSGAQIVVTAYAVQSEGFADAAAAWAATFGAPKAD